MKRYLLTTLALAALAGTALAQQPSPPPTANAPAPAVDVAAPPPPLAGSDRPDDRAWPHPGGPDGAMGPRGHRPPPPPPPSKAAHFHVEDGETRIDIKCADDEPMKACSDILLQVIDRLNGPVQP